ncbi:alpha-tocopherol transfer protein-like [Photinus pyralis]|uniref:alpha-tocopherol transfer protein-like n=1 Tax=Photinus pyralis TaxID=7054 RepID=UPI001267698A|nr:alpha-tocopherol transfer protein-like [Photinus pyralis]
MRNVSAQSEYEKDGRLRKDDVMILKGWAEKQRHLPPISEVQLIFFLHSCYYSTELAKSTIESFFTLRAQCPEFFANRDPRRAEVRVQIDSSCFVSLPKKTHDGNRILLYKMFVSEIGKFDPNETVKLLDMGITLDLLQNGTADGIVVVCDLEGATFAHILRVSLSTVRNSYTYLQDAVPVRLKAVHYFNAIGILDSIMAMIKPVVKNELFNSLHVHGSVETVFQYVPKEYFPSDYGGQQPSLKELHETHIQNLIDFAEYFVNEETQIADETKRVARPANANGTFGADGSFKRLEID